MGVPDEVAREWRRLHNEELHDLYASPDIIRVNKLRRIRWEGHVARMGDRTGAYRVLVGRPKGKRLLVRSRRRREDNIKKDLQEVEWGMDWIDLAQNRDK
jgi:hypothetical protein